MSFVLLCCELCLLLRTGLLNALFPFAAVSRGVCRAERGGTTAGYHIGDGAALPTPSELYPRTSNTPLIPPACIPTTVPLVLLFFAWNRFLIAFFLWFMRVVTREAGPNPSSKSSSNLTVANFAPLANAVSYFLSFSFIFWAVRYRFLNETCLWLFILVVTAGWRSGVAGHDGAGGVDGGRPILPAEGVGAVRELGRLRHRRHQPAHRDLHGPRRQRRQAPSFNGAHYSLLLC